MASAFYYAKKNVNNIRIKDLLVDDQRKKLQSINKSSKPKQPTASVKTYKKKRKKKEKLSERDIKELMGMNRDRYERRGGAMRRK